MGIIWNKPASPTFRVNASENAPQPPSDTCSYSSDDCTKYLKRHVPELDDLPPVPPIPEVRLYYPIKKNPNALLVKIYGSGGYLQKNGVV